MLFGQGGNPRLVWCGYDTVGPLENCGVLNRHGNEITLPSWCLHFIDQVESQLRQLPKPDYTFGYPFSARVRKVGEPRPAFLAIPYRPQFDSIKVRVTEACKDTNFECEITGDLSNPGNIMDQVWHGIRGSDVVVSDITVGNPNVLFEVGLSAALGKEVIIIGEQEALPFDIAHATGNAVLAAVAGPSLIRLLDRYGTRLRVELEPELVSASDAGLVAAP